MRGEKEALVPNKAAASAALRSMPAGMLDTSALDVLKSTNWAVGNSRTIKSTVATSLNGTKRTNWITGKGGVASRTDAGQRREGV